MGTRRAINALKKINAPIYERKEYGAEFLLGAELRTNDDKLFADYYREEIREYMRDDGKIINAWGVRQDVHDILAKNSLRTEWINGGLVGIYKD
jgi:hypothetical protein